jgi:hypothetical protein
MRPDTLAAYLDCRSYSDLARKLKVLKKRGYPGIDSDLHRHHKAKVDRFLDPDAVDRERRKKRMLEEARGKP